MVDSEKNLIEDKADIPTEDLKEKTDEETPNDEKTEKELSPDSN